MSENPPAGPGHGRAVPTLVPMRARSGREPHRSATPLELFFDLCFVVAIAQAGSRLAQAVSERHFGHGVVGYLLVFFVIWWAWMNFTWFASAYDTDDVPYRIATFVQICGVLVIAAGIPRAFDNNDFSVAVAGYIIMRIALTCQWLRAARNEHGPARVTALRYAAGLVVVQTAWIILVFLPVAAWVWGFIPLAVAELVVPIFAERHHRTPWHAHHIGERYGLFTLIMLGESVAAATIAVQRAIDSSVVLDVLLPVAAGGLLIVFAAYWIYFAAPIHQHLRSNREAFLWGYGHYFVFSTAAAIGAGVEVVVEQVTGESDISSINAGATVTVPTAVFLVAVWLLHSRHFKNRFREQLVLPGAATLVLAGTAAGHWAVPLAGVICAGAVAGATLLESR